LVGLPSQVGVVGDGGRVQPVPVRRGQQQPLHRVPGRPQRRLRLGERGVHQHGPARPQGPGHQREHLRGARGQQHLGRWPAVRRGDGRPGRGRVGVAGAGVQRGVQDRAQPRRGRVGAHVDREVDQAGRHLEVAVVAQVDVVVRRLRAAGHRHRDPAVHGPAHDQPAAAEQGGGLGDRRRADGGGHPVRG
jgi:hypothetical protein